MSQILTGQHINTHHSCFLTWHLVNFSDTLEEGRRVKKARAPIALDILPEPDQQLERNNLNPESTIPPGFLSPSVKEYLELGKSIPGKFISVIGKRI